MPSLAVTGASSPLTADFVSQAAPPFSLPVRGSTRGSPHQIFILRQHVCILPEFNLKVPNLQNSIDDLSIVAYLVACPVPA